MASKIADDPRIDPRLKGVFGAMEAVVVAEGEGGARVTTK